MSRIGKLPVQIPEKVTVNVNNGLVSVTGPKGSLELQTRPEVTIEVQNNEVVVTRHNDEKASRSYHGLYRQLVRNMIQGVTTGFRRFFLSTELATGQRLRTISLLSTLVTPCRLSTSSRKESPLQLMALQSLQSAESARRRLASAQLKSVPSEAQSRIRVRESSTKTRLSAARLVSPVARNKAV